MEIKISEYGKRIFDQNIGTKVANVVTKGFSDNKEKTILNFIDVESINTAFWNAFLSELISKFGREKLSRYFSIKNGNATIERTLAISLQLMEFMDDE